MPEEDAADGGNADECRPREVDLALDRVERGSDRRRDHDRGERRAGCLVGREAREHHQQWHGDDAAADAEQRAEQARDEADRDDLQQAGVEPPRRRDGCIGARGNRGAVVLGALMPAPGRSSVPASGPLHAAVDRPQPAEGVSGGQQPGNAGEREGEPRPEDVGQPALGDGADGHEPGEHEDVDADDPAAQPVGRGELEQGLTVRDPGREADAGDEQQDDRGGDAADDSDPERRQAEPRGAERERSPAGAATAGDDERPEGRSDAEARVERAEDERARVEDIRREGWDEHAEVESGEAHRGRADDDRTHQRRGPDVGEAIPDRRERRLRLLVARDREELRGAHQQERDQHGHERDSIEHEAPADTDDRDQDATERRPDCARRVEEARVERDRIRQLVPSDELVDERLAARPLDHDRGAAENRDA